jgi:predicted phosphoribosyltransferase
MDMFWDGPKYTDREEAGRVLGDQLVPYKDEDPVIVAIPNGGVAVALPIAEVLGRPLSIVVVRKLKIPNNPEAGFGSVASDGSLHLNEPLIRRLDLMEDVIEKQKALALDSIRSRLTKYGKAAAFPDIQGKTVILIDDGLASGLTMEAAVGVCRDHNPKSVVVAVPTSSRTAFKRLSKLADKIICPDVSRLPVFAVADAYNVWRDLTDEEVILLLRASKRIG